MTHQVLEQAGSDSSYDLIVEAITPPPREGILVEVSDPDHQARAGAVLAELRPFLTLDPRYGYRVRLFQRVPDPWVWIARFEAVHHKLTERASLPGAETWA